jgi:hypothetical protein
LSSIAPSTRLGWRLLPAVVATAGAVIAASLMIGALRDGATLAATTSARPAAGADVAQAARWRTDSFPVGRGGGLSKKERARFKQQKDRVRAVVRGLADALVIEPAGLTQAARRVMTKTSATALVRQAPRMPKNAESVTVIARGGRIGIQAPRFSAAAAQLHVVMRATIGDRLVKWRDDYRFWLQRKDGAWRVIAFDLDRTQR